MLKELLQEKETFFTRCSTLSFKTSGTTSGAKYIPISKALCLLILMQQETHFNLYSSNWEDRLFKWKQIFLQGNPNLEKRRDCFGLIVWDCCHYVPPFTVKQMPSWETNCIEDWEKK